MSLSDYFCYLMNFYETWLVCTKIIQKHQYYVNVASWILQ
jgi:hypothetical protein